MQLKIQRLTPTAKIPTYAHSTDSGMDLYVDSQEPIILNSGAIIAVPTGIAIELPPGTEAQIRPRSGLALKRGITVVNTPGTIDEGYRGEIKIILTNLSREPFTIEPGSKIAQMVICPVLRPCIVETFGLTESERGSGGFGSTGI